MEELRRNVNRIINPLKNKMMANKGVDKERRYKWYAFYIINI